MTRHQVVKDADVQTERGSRRFDVADRPFQFEVIPQVCTVAEVCHFLRISPRQFSRLMARRVLALAEVKGLDTNRRFTGESVAKEIKRLSQIRVA